MDVQLTSPAKGKNPGDTASLPDGEARWLLANGYARRDDDGSHLLDSSVEAASDPTLAMNREEPGTPPGSVANQEGASWTEQVVERAEFKGKRVTGKAKVVPGRPETLVAASERVLEADQPATAELAEPQDPLADEDLTERPDVTAEDTTTE